MQLLRESVSSRCNLNRQNDADGCLATPKSKGRNPKKYGPLLRYLGLFVVSRRRRTGETICKSSIMQLGLEGESHPSGPDTGSKFRPPIRNKRKAHSVLCLNEMLSFINKWHMAAPGCVNFWHVCLCGFTRKESTLLYIIIVVLID